MRMIEKVLCPYKDLNIGIVKSPHQGGTRGCVGTSGRILEKHIFNVMSAVNEKFNLVPGRRCDFSFTRSFGSFTFASPENNLQFASARHFCTCPKRFPFVLFSWSTSGSTEELSQ